MMIKENRRVYYVFSPFLRMFHWIMVASILTLFATGLLITHPISIAAVEPSATWLSMNLVRDIHIFCAFMFTGSIVFRIYGFFVNPGDRLMPRVWEGHFYREFLDVALHYMLLRYEHKPYLRNPMARLSYGGFYATSFVIILTGFSIYFMDTDSVFGWFMQYVNISVGGIFTARLIHHYLAWFVILVAIGHMYMVFRADLMDAEGEASSMFSGFKLYREKPLDTIELGLEGHTKEFWDENPELAAERAKIGGMR